ncbi:MAG TPA: FAD-dependent oxidoreductase [Streptosporangiaceae bacterium]|jgi:3-phenylpropionate/trans-cinnamate dioxygenase ferredoxin reductase subunit|nr:FAD-dependent oxidoreductase [Streptosporangiaceae bacterium]
MPSGPTFVIVGASLAGARAAEGLRTEGFEGQIILIGHESHYPYERPPLSKGYLLGTEDRDSFVVHEQSWYADHGVDLRLSTGVTAIDRDLRQLTLSTGETLGYDKLLLTTGATPRLLPVPGATANGVMYLRSVDDSDRLRQTLASASSVVVVGAGWIGLEVAAAARTAGVATSVVSLDEQPLLPVLGPEVAPVFADLHREHGVDLRLGVEVERINVGADAVTGVRLADGTELAADAVIVGVGVSPAAELAEAAGLDVDEGVLTDAALRTSDPDIYAAGDVARAYHPLIGHRIRVEHWANARHQPVAAARAMLGQDVAYDRLPYFFSDQYDLGMEYTGYVTPDRYDRVIFRGDVAKREFIAFWLSRGLVQAGMNVNIWDVADEIRDLIRDGLPVDPDRLADPNVPIPDTRAKF